MPNLFSYGTLQLEAVQLELFGRRLFGRPARLDGFAVESVDIDDPAVVRLSGSAQHLGLRPTRDPADSIEGTIFELTDAELAAADDYETSAYARTAAISAGGIETFVYILVPGSGRDR